MGALYHQNFGYAKLNTGINNAATTIVVKSGHNFPVDASKYFKLIIWDATTYPNPADDPNLEIVTGHYAGTLNNYTITRAEEGTTAVAHSANADLAMTITAGVLDDLIDLSLPDYINGSALEGSVAATERSGTNSSMTKLKELGPMRRAGTITVSFDGKSAAWSDHVNHYGRIYKNGSAVGSNHQLTTTYQTFTDTITVAIGDVISLWAGDPQGDTSYVKNLKVLCGNPTTPGEVL